MSSYIVRYFILFTKKLPWPGDSEENFSVSDRCGQGLREGGSGGTSYPGLGGHGRAQVSALSFGIAAKHRNQICLQQKCQSAYLVLVIGRYFCFTAFRTSNSGRFD